MNHERKEPEYLYSEKQVASGCLRLLCLRTSRSIVHRASVAERFGGRRVILSPTWRQHGGTGPLPGGVTDPEEGGAASGRQATQISRSHVDGSMRHES